MENKLMFRLRSEINSPRQWRFATSITTEQLPPGITWLKFELDNGDTLYCHQSQIDCIIDRETHNPS